MKIALLILSFCFHCIYAQVGIKVFNARPTEDFGFNVSPTISGDLIFKAVDNEKFLMPRLGFGFAVFKPRMDTIPTYIVYQATYNSTLILPATLVHSNVYVYYMNPGIDFKIKLKDGFNLYPGVDLTFGHARTYYSENSTYQGHHIYTSAGYYYGFGPRVGFEYILMKKIAFFAEIKRNFNKVLNGGIINYNEYSLGTRIQIFKK